MPERDVLERCMSVAPEQAGETGNLLTTDGVALVRHGRRAFLTARERLFDFANLRFLQTTDFERKFLEGRSRDGDGREQLSVTITLNDLRGDRRRFEAERATDSRFNGRIEMRVRPHGSRDLADRHDRPGALQPYFVSLQLGVP